MLFSYGYKINRDGKDSLLSEAFQGVDNFAQAVMPGAFLVDLVPQREWPLTRVFRHRTLTSPFESSQCVGCRLGSLVPAGSAQLRSTGTT